MLFIPKKYKFKKQQKGKSLNKTLAPLSLNKLTTGLIGLKALSFGRITSKQLESVYKIITKSIKKSGRLILRIFPNTPITKKPIEIRMGKGKGNVDCWVARIKPGTLLCEIETDMLFLARRSLKLAQLRISLKTKIVVEF